MTTWRGLLEGARAHVGHLDARRILEEASGWDGAVLLSRLDETAPSRGRQAVDAMVARRRQGEPLQYVVGRWGFRRLDLMVDRRVLIPRPETEAVVEIALAEARGLGERAGPLVAVDLGTGSGAIALSLAVELPGAEVWATDVSADALAVARANLAGTGGAAATHVRLQQGDWYAALPPELAGRVHLVVSNPPYVASGEELPANVAEWEPTGALYAGPTGLEQISAVVEGAPGWLATPGALVVEIAPHQAEAAVGLSTAAGLDARVEPDLAGRPRALVARRA